MDGTTKFGWGPYGHCGTAKCWSPGSGGHGILWWEPLGEHANQINEMVLEFGLNKEQERAFWIVANHFVSAHKDQLKMYLGGMGGTGKSQVLAALSDFFALQKEAHRFVIVAPTGSAAALLGDWHTIECLE